MHRADQHCHRTAAGEAVVIDERIGAVGYDSEVRCPQGDRIALEGEEVVGSLNVGCRILVADEVAVDNFQGIAVGRSHAEKTS